MLFNLSSLLSGMAALAAVLGLVWLAGRAARLSGITARGSSGRIVAVRETVALDARRRLHLVRCGEQEVLLLTGGGQDLVVGWLGCSAANNGRAAEMPE